MSDARFVGLSNEELADIWYALGGAETRHPGGFGELVDAALRGVEQPIRGQFAFLSGTSVSPIPVHRLEGGCCRERQRGERMLSRSGSKRVCARRLSCPIGEQGGGILENHECPLQVRIRPVASAPKRDRIDACSVRGLDIKGRVANHDRFVSGRLGPFQRGLHDVRVRL